MTKNILVSVVVSAVVGLLVVFGFASQSGVSTDENNVGDIKSQIDSYSNGVELGGIVENYGSFTVGAQDDSDGWKNITGKTIYVDMLSVTTDGTASTTFAIDVATSSTRDITSDSDPFSEFVDSYVLATSTSALTINSIENGGTNGTSIVPVDDGEWISLLLTAPYSNGEEATSTYRGFTNLDVRFRYWYPGN